MIPLSLPWSATYSLIDVTSHVQCYYARTRGSTATMWAEAGAQRFHGLVGASERAQSVKTCQDGPMTCLKRSVVVKEHVRRIQIDGEGVKAR